MSVTEATAARQAKALEAISAHLKELIKVLGTMNQNFVDVVRKFQDADITVTTTEVDPDQISLVEDDETT